MSVTYRRLPVDISRDRERVSDQWYWVLMELRKRGYHFNVNEGHRTMARQWELYRTLGPYNGSSGAAYPSPSAPHIRVGRFDHAIDFDGADTVITGLRKLGVAASKPVAGESWHVEVNADELAREAAKLKKAKAIDKLKASIRRVTALRKKSYKNKNWQWWKKYSAQLKALQNKLKKTK